MRAYILCLAAFVVFMTSVPMSSPMAAKLLPHPQKNEAGIHTQLWIKDSFLDIAEDIQEADDSGKRLLMLVEAKGCKYCKKMHEVNFREPRIVSYLRRNFDVIQINTKGSNEVTDANGDILSEQKYAARMNLRGTPKLVFFHRPNKASGKRGKKAVAFSVTGYFSRDHFYNMLEYVKSEGYVKQPNFFKWLKSSAPKTKIKFK